MPLVSLFPSIFLARRAIRGRGSQRLINFIDARHSIAGIRREAFYEEMLRYSGVLKNGLSVAAC